MSDGWNIAIANQVINTLQTKHLDDDEANKLKAGAAEALVGIKPQDEIEGMIGAQMIACYNASMECFGAPCCRIFHSTRATAISIQETSCRGRMRRAKPSSVTSRAGGWPSWTWTCSTITFCCPLPRCRLRLSTSVVSCHFMMITLLIKTARKLLSPRPMRHRRH